MCISKCAANLKFYMTYVFTGTIECIFQECKVKFFTFSTCRVKIGPIGSVLIIYI